MTPITRVRRVIVPTHWTSFIGTGVAGWGLLLLVWWWVVSPRLPYEEHLHAPVVRDPVTLDDRTVYVPGETIAVQWDTRILRDCPARYERWARRADGVTIPPGAWPRTAPHGGHYTVKDAPDGQGFIALWHLPPDMQRGSWAGWVRVTAQCSPLAATVEESPRFTFEVR